MISWRYLSHTDISVSHGPSASRVASPRLPASFASLLLLLWCLLACGPWGCRLLLSWGDHVAGGGCRWAGCRPWSGGGRGATGCLTGIPETQEKPKSYQIAQGNICWKRWTSWKHLQLKFTVQPFKQAEIWCLANAVSCVCALQVLLKQTFVQELDKELFALGLQLQTRVVLIFSARKLISAISKCQIIDI